MNKMDIVVVRVCQFGKTGELFTGRLVLARSTTTTNNN